MTKNGVSQAELIQLCQSYGGTSTLLDTVLSNFNEIDADHNGKVTASEISAYGIDSEIKDKKEQYLSFKPSRMSVFYDLNDDDYGSDIKTKQDE